MASEDGKQLSMDQILDLGTEVPPEVDGGPEALDRERMGVDERAAYEEQQAAEATAEGPKEDAQADAQPEPEQDERPRWMDDAYLERHPGANAQWKDLREQNKDFRNAAKEAREAYEAALKQEAELRAELERVRAQASRPVHAPQAQPAAPPPSFDENPEGYLAAVESRIAERIEAQRYDQSEAQARKAYGAERVDKAFADFSRMAESDPTLPAGLRASLDPWEYVVQEVDRRAKMAEIGDDPDAFIAKRLEAERERIREEERARLLESGAIHPATEAAIARAQPRIPTSLAPIPGTGHIPASEGAWEGPQSMKAILQSKLDR